MSGFKSVSFCYGLNLRRGVFSILNNDYKSFYNIYREHNLVRPNLQTFRYKHVSASNHRENDVECKKKIYPNVSQGPDLKDFIKSDAGHRSIEPDNVPYLKPTFGNHRKGEFQFVYFDSLFI